MKFIEIRGTSQENIAKEVVEVAKRRGLELNFQVLLFKVKITVSEKN
jgi:hypothetical protein